MPKINKAFQDIAKLDALLAVLKALDVNTMQLQAFAHARGLDKAADETLADMPELCRGREKHDAWDQLSLEREQAHDEGRDFVNYYYDDVRDALDAIKRRERVLARQRKAKS